MDLKTVVGGVLITVGMFAVGLYLGGLRIGGAGVRKDAGYIHECREIVAFMEGATEQEKNLFREWRATHPKDETSWRIIQAIAKVEPAPGDR